MYTLILKKLTRKGNISVELYNSLKQNIESIWNSLQTNRGEIVKWNTPLPVLLPRNLDSKILLTPNRAVVTDLNNQNVHFLCAPGAEGRHWSFSLSFGKWK